MLKKFRRLADIEARGGNYIREKIVGRSYNGTYYNGTLHFDRNKDIPYKMFFYLSGGAKFVGPISGDQKDEELLDEYFKDLEKNDKSFRVTLFERLITISGCYIGFFIMMVMLAKELDNAAKGNLSLVMITLYAIMMGVFYLLLRRIRRL